MKFITSEFNAIFIEKLKKAKEVKIASAYLSPDDEIVELFNNISNVKIIFSSEYQINNPYKIEKIGINKLHCIYPDDAKGKLHAKVFYILDENNNVWCWIGSLNLTRNGLLNNQETCIELNSNLPEEKNALNEILKWFNDLWNNSAQPNLENAKLIYDKYSIQKDKLSFNIHNSNCWVIKASEGDTGKNQWEFFLKHFVISIGFDIQNFDIIKASHKEIKEEYGSVSNSIINFRDNIQINDNVIVCRGYVSNQIKDVHVNGIAKVTGQFKIVNNDEWNWHMRRDVIFYPLNINVPVKKMIQIFNKGSLRQTLHNLEQQSFENFLHYIKEEHNIVIATNP